MSLLHSLLETLTEKQITTFCTLIELTGTKNDLKLLKLILEFPDASNEELCEKLYGDKNMKAFYSARQRLQQKVFEFTSVCELEDDNTRSAAIRNMENIAGRLLRYNKSEDAAEIFSKAGVEAKKYRHLGLLDQVLFRQAKYSQKLNLNAPLSISEWRLNGVALEKKREVEILRVTLKNEVSESMDTGDPKEADAMIDRIFSAIEITPEQLKDPHFVLDLTAMSRDAFLSEKKYKLIEPYVYRMYTRLKETGAFDKTTIACEIEFVLMIAHALYRNLKFLESGDRLKYIDSMSTKDTSDALAHLPKIIAMRAGICFYSGKLDESIAQLEAALQDKAVLADEEEYYNVKVNLSVNYFAAKRYREANAMMISLPRDKELRALMGKEWLMKKDMIYMLIQYHLGNDDIALTFLNRSVETFAELFDKPIYKLSGKFLELIDKIFKDRNVLKDADFIREVNEARKSWPKDQQDLHAITFYCWLKALLVGKDYYDVLLEKVNSAESE